MVLTGKRSAVPRFHLRHGRAAFTVAAGAAVFVAIVAEFTPFVTDYGDDYAYVHTSVFDLSSYQPLWGFVAGGAYRDVGLQGLFLLQALLYSLSILLAVFASRRLDRRLAWIVGLFMLFDVQAYVYVASPLTENLSLFLFVLGLWLWCSLDVDRRWLRAGRLFALALVLLALAFTRNSNELFVIVLAAAVGVRVLRHDTAVFRLALVVLVPLALVLGLRIWSLQDGANATGVNLERFLLAACLHGPCPSDAFTSDQTPILRDYYLATGSVVGVDQAFLAHGLSSWSPEFGTEMSIAYVRLAREAPWAVGRGVLFNWVDQVRSGFAPAYAEDPNAVLVQRPWFLVLNVVTVAISRLLALVAPVVTAYVGVRVVVMRRVPLLVVYATSWLLVELVTSQWLYMGILASETPRMRLHYMVPALILTWWAVADVVVLLRRRRTSREPGSTARTLVAP